MGMASDNQDEQRLLFIFHFSLWWKCKRPSVIMHRYQVGHNSDKMDILLIAEQLPPNFLPAFLSKVSPVAYIRFRQTCCFMNNYAEEQVGNFRVPLYFKKVDHFDAFVKSQVHRSKYVPNTSVFGFHFRYLDVRFHAAITDAELLQIEGFIHSISCDKRIVTAVRNQYDLLYRLNRIRSPSVEICNRDDPLQLEILKEPQFEKFDGLVVADCKLSPQFNIVDLAKHKHYLELTLSESWEEAYPLFSQFLQDVYNDIDVGLLEEFSISMKEPHKWSWNRQPLSNEQLGNLPFSLLYGYNCKSGNPTFNRSFIYYGETKTRNLLLSVHHPVQQYITVRLFIIPIDDFSTFVKTLGYLLFEANCRSFKDDQFIWDYSTLFSLLEGIQAELYPAIVAKNADDLYEHMNKGRT